MHAIRLLPLAFLAGALVSGDFYLCDGVQEFYSFGPIEDTVDFRSNEIQRN